VVVDVAESSLRQAILRALEATSQTIEVSEKPDLVICDKPGNMEGEAWRLEMPGGKQAQWIDFTPVRAGRQETRRLLRHAVLCFRARTC
jgi:hypothetical protein